MDVFCYCWEYCDAERIADNASNIKKHDIFTNRRHITTKTTSSIKVTPEPAPIAIYVVCSSPVRIINYENLDI